MNDILWITLPESDVPDGRACLQRVWPYHFRVLPHIDVRVWPRLFPRIGCDKGAAFAQWGPEPSYMIARIDSWTREDLVWGTRTMVFSDTPTPPPPEFSEAVEILFWERRNDRGPLHDPPERWHPLDVELYLNLRGDWQRPGRSWLREGMDVILPYVPAQAYAVFMRGELAGGLLLWMPHPDLAYILDVTWRPDVGPRTVVRYLLQELYMYYPQAHVVLDGEEVGSPLNRILLALGYRVYRRAWDVRRIL